MTEAIKTLDMSQEEWLEQRKKGIGGSDAGAICGLNPWKSAVEVYLDKLGELPPVEDNERMRIGRDLEAYVAKRFEEATGKKVRRHNFMEIHPDHDFMLANVDRKIVGENALLECKTTGSYSAKDWADGKVPAHYELQCHHYMAVTGAERVYIAVLIGNQEFKWETIERDEEVIENLIKIESDFWHDHVLAKEPPAPDGSEGYDKVLSSRYQGTDEEVIQLDSVTDKLDRLDKIGELMDELKEEQKLHQQEIKALMGEHTVASVMGRKVTWKPQIRRSFDSKRLREEQPDIYEAYCKESKSRPFKVY